MWKIVNLESEYAKLNKSFLLNRIYDIRSILKFFSPITARRLISRCGLKNRLFVWPHSEEIEYGSFVKNRVMLVRRRIEKLIEAFRGKLHSGSRWRNEIVELKQKNKIIIIGFQKEEKKQYSAVFSWMLVEEIAKYRSRVDWREEPSKILWIFYPFLETLDALRSF